MIIGEIEEIMSKNYAATMSVSMLNPKLYVLCVQLCELHLNMNEVDNLCKYAEDLRIKNG